MFPDSINIWNKCNNLSTLNTAYVSNHFYILLSGDEKEQGFHLPKQRRRQSARYFATANYLDSAIKDFFDYSQGNRCSHSTSIIVMYGDHYGISDTQKQQSC